MVFAKTINLNMRLPQLYFDTLTSRSFILKTFFHSLKLFIDTYYLLLISLLSGSHFLYNLIIFSYLSLFSFQLQLKIFDLFVAIH